VLEHRHEFLGSVERPAREFGDGQAQSENAAGGCAGHEVKELSDGSIGELFDAGENQGGDDAADAAAVDGENADGGLLVSGCWSSAIERLRKGGIRGQISG
jgi:hypothetical protein